VPDPYASGNHQCGLQGEALAKPFRVIVEGAVQPGLLGGKGGRPRIPGTTVTFAVEKPETGAVFVESEAATLNVATDAGGMASATLRLGRSCGDVDVQASVETRTERKVVRFRALSGVTLIGANLEANTDAVIQEFGVQLRSASGAFVEGVPVFFATVGHEASIGQEMVLTDEMGKAVTSWKMGGTVQQYVAEVDIRDSRQGIAENDRFECRYIEFEAMAINRSKLLVELIGGIAVFILGMRGMSIGLQRMADRRLKSILRAMTKNRFVAVGVGAGITAMIQASGATTVLTVGFVNAGLVTLTQAIGVIYGANIGTTVTAQIIAFRLDALAYPAIAIGLILSAVGRRPWQKALGEAVLGFGLLFLGMTIMSSILKPLRYSPSFQSWFQMFDCTPDAGGFVKAGPALMCVLIGTATTCIVQSSSATVGLVMALASQGLLTFYTAVPFVLGDNIGTTITALLASLGANRNAKRAALAHTLFNVFGAVYMYALFFVPIWHGQPVFLGFIDAITPGQAFASIPENLARHVANAHTVFNVFNCLLFLPMVGVMARVCQAIIPVSEVDRESVLEYLEPRLLRSPALALELAVKEVGYMLRRAQKSLNESCDFFFKGTRELEEKILERESVIDRLQEEITAYLVELSRRDLRPSEASLIPALIHVVNDTERIGDHSENLVELGHLVRDQKRSLSPVAHRQIRDVQAVLNRQFEQIYDILASDGSEGVDEVTEREKELTRILAEAGESHVARLEQGKCEIQAGVIYLDVLAHLERVGDHLLNIAERAGTITIVTKG